MAWGKQCFLEEDITVFLMYEGNPVQTPTSALAVLVLSSTIPILLHLLALGWETFTQPSIDFIRINTMLKGRHTNQGSETKHLTQKREQLLVYLQGKYLLMRLRLLLQGQTLSFTKLSQLKG
jgi:hypothetical protein